jgi:hypothetical protein
MTKTNIACAAFTAAALGFGAVATPASAGGHADTVYSWAIVSGGELTKNSHEAWTGLFFALNRDFSKDGFVLRLLGSTGSYDYKGVTQTFDSDYYQGDAMIGYQIVRGGLDIAAYVGVEHLNYDISPDDTFNKLRGSDTGFKAALDFETNGRDGRPFYFLARGSYSTAFDSYFALGRIGYDFGRFTIGPEAWLLGDTSYNAHRIGGFIDFELPIKNIYSHISISAGYQFIDDVEVVGGYKHGKAGEDSAYATIKFTTAFGDSPRSHGPLK